MFYKLSFRNTNKSLSDWLGLHDYLTIEYVLDLVLQLCASWTYYQHDINIAHLIYIV